MNAADVALPPGALLGNYKLLKVLGQGGFGISYIAWDTQLRRNVVLKECFPMGMCSRDMESGEIVPLPHAPAQLYRRAMDSLRKEAQTLASLNHERIVRVYDVFESHGSIFYVMPWLEGGSLRERMDEAATGKNPLLAEKVVEWLIYLLDGLAYLHNKGIYHRDIKPGNILFDERGLPVLIDFGAALNMPEVTVTITQGEFSYAYASPEQITGKGKIGPWTDLYALAVTWYELISGVMAESAGCRLMQDDVVPLSDMKLSQAWPRELLASVDRNLRLSPGERCLTAVQWKEWLERGKPRGLKNAGSFRKNMVYGGVAVALVGGVGVWMWQQQQKEGLKPLPVLPPTEGDSKQTDAGYTDLEAMKDALYKKVYAYYKMDDYLAKSKEYKQKVDALLVQCDKETKEWAQNREKEIGAADREAIEKLLQDDPMRNEHRDLIKKWEKILGEAVNKYWSEVMYPMLQIPSELLNSYSVETKDELALIPFVQSRLYFVVNDVNNVYHETDEEKFQAIRRILDAYYKLRNQVEERFYCEDDRGASSSLPSSSGWGVSSSLTDVLRQKPNRSGEQDKKH